MPYVRGREFGLQVSREVKVVRDRFEAGVDDWNCHSNVDSGSSSGPGAEYQQE